MSTAGQIPELELTEAWAILRDDPQAVLIDVRTPEEWKLVGVPVLDSINKSPRLAYWTAYGTGAPNQAFLSEATGDLDPDTPLLFLCRSGVRSKAAAGLVALHGFTTTYNITAGFEGNLGPNGQRKTGWRDCGLPWRHT